MSQTTEVSFSLHLCAYLHKPVTSTCTTLFASHASPAHCCSKTKRTRRIGLGYATKTASKKQYFKSVKRRNVYVVEMQELSSMSNKSEDSIDVNITRCIRVVVN